METLGLISLDYMAYYIWNVVTFFAVMAIREKIYLAVFI